MGGQTELLGALEREVAAEVEAVLSRGKRRAAGILSDARLRSEARLAEGRRSLAAEQERAGQRAVARARLLRENRLLARRSEELEATFAAAADALRAMAQKEPGRFGELLWTLFLSGRRLLPEQELLVRLGEGGEAVFPRIAAETGVSLAREKGWYGLILEDAGGLLRVDCSLATLLEDCRREHRAELEELLFGGEGGS